MSDADQFIYSIGMLANLLKIPPYVFRYWEKEFSDFITPIRTSGNQRRYSDKDLLMLKRIKKMLYDDKYSIAGARLALQKIETKALPLSELEVDTIVDIIRKKLIQSTLKSNRVLI